MCIITPWGTICLPDWPTLIAVVSFVMASSGAVLYKIRKWWRDRRD